MLECKSLNIGEYLKRIGFTGSRDATLDTLCSLCWCHATSVPQDTMDMFGGPKMTFDLDRIYHSIVVNHRGGCCYEINGLFGCLLQKLGFDVAVLEGSAFQSSCDVFSNPFDHLLLKVSIDGAEWLSDVGYGAPSFFEPLQFKLMVEQVQMTGIYRIRQGADDEMFYVEKHKNKRIDSKSGLPFVSTSKTFCSKYSQDKQWKIVFRFSTTPRTWEDFKKEYCRHVEDENGFSRNNSFLEVFTKDGVAILWGRNLILKTFIDSLTEIVSHRHITDDEELTNLMKSIFGVALTFRPDFTSREYSPPQLGTSGESQIK